MPADGLPDEAAIIAAAYADRLRDLFKILSEAIYTGEPERDAIVRFRRGLVSARRAYAATIEALKDGG
jgi:hypothetical protein